ncbi:hypothetical protein BGZ88_005515 [Linnemannia elongata]|nr:hypothetical protein BGZ88_005515 [Linnemannia elongata]
MRVRSVELSDISIQARSVETVNLQSKESLVSSPVESPVELPESLPELPQFKVGDVVVDINPALEVEKRVQMIELLERNRDRFTMDMQDLEITTVLEHEVNVIPGSKPVYVGWSPRYAPKEMEFLKKSISEELATGVVM